MTLINKITIKYRRLLGFFLYEFNWAKFELKFI